MSELNYASALAALDNDFAQANAQTGNSSVPVGRYNAILKEAKIVPRNGGGLSVSISFVVTDGAYKGRYAFTSYGLHKNGLPYFKGFLQMIQLPLTGSLIWKRLCRCSRGTAASSTCSRTKKTPVHPHLCGPLPRHGQSGRIPEHPRAACRAG